MQERSDSTDETMGTDSREAAATGDKGKKAPKLKGIKHGGKFWLKS